ncbi:MAG: TonB-dependent receptor [Acidobacteriota bacterium]
MFSTLVRRALRGRVPVLALFFALVLSLAPAGTERAHADDSARLSGVVVFAPDRPAADAVVRLPALRRSVAVDDEGRFRFDNLPAGLYTLEALSARYGTGVIEVQIDAGATVTAEILLDVASVIDEVVVTGREARNRFDIAQPTSVLGGEELSIRLTPSLGETLAQEPGVNATSFAPGASRPVIRGLGDDRVRILKGGIPTSDASDASVDHAVTVDPALAERIEIIRGPATLLYGSSGIGGVVNIIDNAIPAYPATQAVGGHVELRGGSVADERGGSFVLNGGTGDEGTTRFAWHVSGVHRDTDDYEIPGFAEADHDDEHGDDDDDHGHEEEEEAFGVLPNSAIETTAGNLGATIFFGDRGSLGVSVSGFDTLYGIPGHGHEEGEDDDHGDDDHGDEDDDDHGHDGEGEEEEEEVRIDMEQRRVDLRGELLQAFGPFQAARFTLAVTDYEHFELEGEEIGTTFLNDAFEGRLELIQKARGANTGTIGLQWLDRDLEAQGEEAFIPESQRTGFALFTYQELVYGDLRWEFGLRYDDQETEAVANPDRSADGVSGSVGLTWNPGEDYGLGVSLARSVKLPDLRALYANGPHLATGTFEVGDPNLDEEVGLGFDVSLRKRSGKVQGEITGFINRIDDFIYELETGGIEDGLPIFQFVQADAEFVGVEVQSRIELWEQNTGSSRSHLDLQLFGDYVRAELRDAAGTPLPRIPPLRLGAGLHFHTDRLHAMAEVRHSAEQDRTAPNETETDEYTLVNASVSYRFFGARAIYDVLLRGNNLTDEEARNHVSFQKDVVPLPGRDISLALRVRF